MARPRGGGGIKAGPLRKKILFLRLKEIKSKVFLAIKDLLLVEEF